jgi:hypothetical protein
MGVRRKSLYDPRPRRAFADPSGQKDFVMETLEKRAETAQTTLFHRYDVLTALWTKAEKELTVRHVPHEIEYTYYSPGCYQDAEIDPMIGMLGIAKIDGKWRLCHAERYYQSEEPTKWTPIVDCSAYMRVQMARHLPKLREAVVAASEQFIPKVDGAIAALQKELHCEPDNLMELLAERAKLNGKHPGK